MVVTVVVLCRVAGCWNQSIRPQRAVNGLLSLKTPVQLERAYAKKAEPRPMPIGAAGGRIHRQAFDSPQPLFLIQHVLTWTVLFDVPDKFIRSHFNFITNFALRRSSQGCPCKKI